MSLHKLPKKLPKTYPSMHGPVPIVWRDSDELKEEWGEFVWGMADYTRRQIELNKKLLEAGNNLMMWKTYHHEGHHIHMEDVGLNQIFKTDKRELICEAHASARILEMQTRGYK